MLGWSILAGETTLSCPLLFGKMVLTVFYQAPGFGPAKVADLLRRLQRLGPHVTGLSPEVCFYVESTRPLDAAEEKK